MELTITQNGALYALHHRATKKYSGARKKLGVVGSLVGGFVTHLFISPKEGSLFHPVGIIFSILGALLAFFLWNKLNVHLPT